MSAVQQRLHSAELAFNILPPGEGRLAGEYRIELSGTEEKLKKAEEILQTVKQVNSSWDQCGYN